MRPRTHWQWHLDEVFVKINGQMHYLWRAVDHEGEVRECQIFCVWLIRSMLPERSKDYDNFQRVAGRTVEGLRAA